MKLFENLIASQHIQKGTWVGLSNTDGPILHRFVVDSCEPPHTILVSCSRTLRQMQVPVHMIAEIEGMTIDRFLVQAELTPEGEKAVKGPRRGRKRKVRT